jgi:hypothetical protein
MCSFGVGAPCGAAAKQGASVHCTKWVGGHEGQAMDKGTVSSMK